MKKSLLLNLALVPGFLSLSAQTFITEAPAGGFDVDGGKDYVVLYAPSAVLDAMGSKIISNNNLDDTQVDNYLEYWVTDWDKKALTLYNVPASEGEVNSFGTADFINATPLYEWGTGVFMAKAKAYDLSKVTDEHYLHIGLRDFGTSPSMYQFSIGSQKTIATNGFQVMAGLGVGQTSGNFVGIGAMPGGNDGKWYYIDVPVSALVDENGDFGFSYDFSAPITDGVFTFTFNKPVCSTATTSGPAPGETVYNYNITKLGSALSLDHVFFYVPDSNGLGSVAVEEEERVEAIYDLAGRLVAQPESGLYIVKTNLGTRKMYIK
ncbi:MAG: hypothetical protein NC418_00605 [Muribaculaceae bacterium]|nr:hypothetical protein [Muribaculaceae bacterium]